MPLRSQFIGRLLCLGEKGAQANSPLFITLTYADFTDDWKVWKWDWTIFLKALKRRVAGSAGLWRSEYQNRGGPHFHLLVWPEENRNYEELRVEEMKAWDSESWVRRLIVVAQERLVRFCFSDAD